MTIPQIVKQASASGRPFTQSNDRNNIGFRFKSRPSNIFSAHNLSNSVQTSLDEDRRGSSTQRVLNHVAVVDGSLDYMANSVDFARR